MPFTVILSSVQGEVTTQPHTAGILQAVVDESTTTAVNGYTWKYWIYIYSMYNH